LSRCDKPPAFSGLPGLAGQRRLVQVADLPIAPLNAARQVPPFTEGLPNGTILAERFQSDGEALFNDGIPRERIWRKAARLHVRIPAVILVGPRQMPSAVVVT